MKNVVAIGLLFLAFRTVAQDTVSIVDPYAKYIEHIPAEADFDLIQDRLSCIEGEIPLHYNTRVHAFVNYFAVKDREYTQMVIDRAPVYFPLFEKYLKKYGIPEELKYLSIVESGLNPTAVSPAYAVGLWQFMSSTGRYFDLHHDWYVDDRMDPEKSTEAACRYLKQLYGMFGNWELAIAAYNTGPGNVRKAIRRSGYKKTFWEIYPYLYRETRSYLPQFVAIAYILNYQEEHNFSPSPYRSIETDTIQVKKYVHLETLASQLNLCKEELSILNPSFKRSVVPADAGEFNLILPVQAKEMLDQNRLAILDSAGKVGKTQVNYLARNTIGSTYGREKVIHTVRSGDVIGILAERYKVRTADIRSWNNLRSNTIRIGQRLVIWQKPGTQVIAKKEPVKPIDIPAGTTTYTVQNGDTLWDISRKFNGLSIAKLKELNRLQTSRIKPGQKLIIAH